MQAHSGDLARLYNTGRMGAFARLWAGLWQEPARVAGYGISVRSANLSLFPPSPSLEGRGSGFTQEREIENPRVDGSIPSQATKSFKQKARSS
jgi:hypothetical protein